MKDYEKAIEIMATADPKDYANFTTMVDFYGIFASDAKTVETSTASANLHTAATQA